VRQRIWRTYTFYRSRYQTWKTTYINESIISCPHLIPHRLALVNHCIVQNVMNLPGTLVRNGDPVITASEYTARSVGSQQSANAHFDHTSWEKMYIHAKCASMIRVQSSMTSLS
jgi:hypothetical protein